MTAPQRYLRPLAAFLTVGLALSISSCSDAPEPKEASSTDGSLGTPGSTPDSDGDVETFCADAAAVTDGSFLDDVDDTTSDDLAGVYASVIELIDAIEPPSEIADDWATMTDATSTMFESMEDIDPESATAMEDLLELMEGMDTEAIDEATSNVEAYIADHCDAA